MILVDFRQPAADPAPTTPQVVPIPLDQTLLGRPVRFSTLAAPSLTGCNGTVSAVLARLHGGGHLVTIEFPKSIKHGGLERRYLDSPTSDLVFLDQAREQAA